MEPESGLILSLEELQKYHTLCNIAYASTGIIDPDLLDRTGMTSKFKTVFNTIGWGGFWMIPELGIELLTQEFLCTLKTSQNGVTFRMFNLDFDLTWSALNTALGCDHDCSLDLNFVVRDFDKTRFWKTISGSSNSSGPIAPKIHNPTLRFIHYWMFVTLFPRTNGFHLQDVELKLL